MWHAPYCGFQTTRLDVPGGRAGAFDTAARMRQLVSDYVSSPIILRAATSIIYLQPQHDQLAEAQALFEFVQGRVRYVRDVVGMETLANPEITLARLVGDCDDQATLLATLYEAVGYPTRFVMAGYHSSNFEHIYLQVLVNSDWINADPIVFEPFGWAGPEPRILWIENR